MREETEEDYDAIRRVRSDVTDELVHMTRSAESLEAIIRAGHLLPTFAPRIREDGSSFPTVKGPYPAVCFSEMALAEVWKLHNAKLATPRYRAFGVSFDKADIFAIGARPVFYDDKELLGRARPRLPGAPEIYEGMPEELQYRFVRLELRGSRWIDWTHEREWRLVRRHRKGRGWQTLPLRAEGGRGPRSFRLFVPTREDAGQLRRFIRELLTEELETALPSRRGYLLTLRDVVIEIAEAVAAAEGLSAPTPPSKPRTRDGSSPNPGA